MQIIVIAGLVAVGITLIESYSMLERNLSLFRLSMNDFQRLKWDLNLILQDEFCDPAFRGITISSQPQEVVLKYPGPTIGASYRYGTILVRSLQIVPKIRRPDKVFATLALSAESPPVLGSPKISSTNFEVVFDLAAGTNVVESCRTPWHYTGPTALYGDICTRFGGRYVPPPDIFHIEGECLFPPGGNR